jgi:TRAP-type uncharacterized transport system substrate-binding protein
MVGDHTISLLKDGYHRYDEKVKVYDRRKVEVKARLIKSPGKRHDVPEIEGSVSIIQSAKIPIPLHPGTAQYLREAGVVK